MAKPRTNAEGEIAAPRVAPRREVILETAGGLFASRGYEATSMRDIAAAVGVMPASLYYHFPSKEDLLVTAVEESVAKIRRAVDSATAGVTDPWERLRAALVAHVGALLDQEGFHVLVMPLVPPGVSEEVRAALVACRKEFERNFVALLEPFALPGTLSVPVLRNLLLTMLNNIPVWYRPDGAASPADIAEQLIDFVRPTFAQTKSG